MVVGLYAKELTELDSDDYKYTYQYYDGMNDMLRIIVNAVQDGSIDNYQSKSGL